LIDLIGFRRRRWNIQEGVAFTSNWNISEAVSVNLSVRAEVVSAELKS
jgi:hypothetical protein